MTEAIPYAFRLATAADADFVYRLNELTMRSYVEQTWGAWDEDFQRTFFKEHFRPDENEVIVSDNEAIGVRSIIRRPDYLFVANIQLLPEWQGRGIGRAILERLLEKEPRVELEVQKVNPARRLYERLGFVIFGETETHYQLRVDAG